MPKLLIDYSQKVISSCAAIANDLKGDDAENLIKHATLNQILKLKKKFDGEIIFAVDSREGYWRKEKFPAYKGHRRHDKAKNDFLPWELIGKTMDSLKEDLKENFKYKIIEVKGAEADDVIAVLCKHFQDNEFITGGLFEEPDTVIIDSTDGDMAQLLKYSNVKQWNNVKDAYVKCDDPKMVLTEYICCGDGGDNVPNILTPTKWSEDRANGIKPERQKPFKKTRLQDFYLKGIEACLNEDERLNYQRNKMLVDLSEIPVNIENSIIHAYNNAEIKGNKSKILSYLSKHRMKMLLEHVNQF